MFGRLRYALGFASVWQPGDLCWMEQRNVIGNTSVRAGVVESVKDDRVLVLIPMKAGADARYVVDPDTLWCREETDDVETAAG